jgi:hypothetical protein
MTNIIELNQPAPAEFLFLFSFQMNDPATNQTATGAIFIKAIGLKAAIDQATKQIIGIDILNICKLGRV